ncbi:MAG: hypothetical protein JWN61_3238 [Pseudonocardiales bacterium]|nr:hypothetical protein [Pseudonocardiales bacterium]
MTPSSAQPERATALPDTGVSGPAFPEFRVRRRGYDRSQVEDYITELRRFLADAEARAAEAYALVHSSARRPPEAGSPPHSPATVRSSPGSAGEG